eukprot:3047083-Pyramimonas_sp.AAC.1
MKVQALRTLGAKPLEGMGGGEWEKGSSSINSSSNRFQSRPRRAGRRSACARSATDTPRYQFDLPSSFPPSSYLLVASSLPPLRSFRLLSYLYLPHP